MALNLCSARRWWYVLGAALALHVSAAGWAGETDATKIVAEPALALPPDGAAFTDPAFGTPSLRLQNARPEYSQLQAWNADMSLLLVNGGQILDASTFERVHTIDFRWPAWGSGLRWSPVDPNVLYYVGGLLQGSDPDGVACPTNQARLMRYRLVRGATVSAQRELVRCFPEYQEFNGNASYEELSDDGRYVALVAFRADGKTDIFSYDLVADAKGTVATFDLDPDWAGMSPSGQYVVVNWGRPTYLGPAPGYREDARFTGVESYARTSMQYLGKVAVSSGHGDLGRDASGNEVYVQTYANTQNFLGDNHYVVMSRIPVGIVYQANGRVDETVTLGQGYTVRLLQVDWSHGMHISCRSRNGGVCTVGTEGGEGNGRQPFEREVFNVFLDSTHSAPHVDRLAQHRSKSYTTSGDPCNNSNYWAQPHATHSPDGTRILYGSNWGRICTNGDPVDAFILTVSASSTPPPPSPPPPSPPPPPPPPPPAGAEVSITSPADGAAVTSSFALVFLVTNWPVTQGGSHLHWFLDGVDQGPHYTTDPIDVNGISLGSHTLMLRLANADHSFTDVSTSVAVTVLGNDPGPVPGPADPGAAAGGCALVSGRAERIDPLLALLALIAAFNVLRSAKHRRSRCADGDQQYQGVARTHE
jgi:hypothetical protein